MVLRLTVGHIKEYTKKHKAQYMKTCMVNTNMSGVGPKLLYLGKEMRSISISFLVLAQNL